MKIFSGQKLKDPVTYSEVYKVHYKYKNLNRYQQDGEETYYSASKKAHHAVESRWRKEHPDDILISITYQ